MKNEPAFPLESPGPASWLGMSLRDWFAGQAMLATLSGTLEKGQGWNYQYVAREAYEAADAMLAERDKAAEKGRAVPSPPMEVSVDLAENKHGICNNCGQVIALCDLPKGGLT